MAGVLLDGTVSLPWFGRVPSHSKIADYPSRLVSHPMLLSSKEHPRDMGGGRGESGRCDHHPIFRK